MKNTLIVTLLLLVTIACSQEKTKEIENNTQDTTMINYKELSDAEWKQKLSDEQFYVLRKQGTERPWTGEYNEHFEAGVYVCAGCGSELFTSDTKFESHCGWPSFYDKINNTGIEERIDRSHGMVRTEVVCSNCGGHLGHIFDDGPNPTGLRYCINSVSLNFVPKKEFEEKSKK